MSNGEKELIEIKNKIEKLSKEKRKYLKAFIDGLIASKNT